MSPDMRLLLALFSLILLLALTLKRSGAEGEPDAMTAIWTSHKDMRST
jgi:hypothetical protein